MKTTSLSTWTLVGQGQDADASDVLSLQEFPCKLGRGNSNHIRLRHPSVSTEHAVFDLVDDQLVIRDLESRNGTFINGNRLRHEEHVRPGDLVQFGERVFRVELHATGQTSIMATCDSDSVHDQALAVAQVERLIQNENVATYVQPIINMQDGRVHAFEALVRGKLFGVEKPVVMFNAASTLRKEVHLSQMLREKALQTIDPQVHLYLNTHPSEVADVKNLIRSLMKLRKNFPRQQITLEIHEAAVVDVTTMKLLRLVLDDLSMGLAFDDFGAGQARMVELVEARPDCLKFDICLIRGIDAAPPARRRMVESLVAIARDLEVKALAEGVETEAEAEVCLQLGFDLAQGYLYGRPEVPASFGVLAQR